MKVGDLRDLTGPLPYVALKGTKTSAARRDVPIHPEALPIILRRVEGREADAFLLDELRTPLRARDGTRTAAHEGVRATAKEARD